MNRLSYEETIDAVMAHVAATPGWMVYTDHGQIRRLDDGIFTCPVLSAAGEQGCSFVALMTAGHVFDIPAVELLMAVADQKEWGSSHEELSRIRDLYNDAVERSNRLAS